MAAAPQRTEVEISARTRRSGLGMFVVLIVQVMLLLDITVSNMALPRIGTGLGFGAAGLSWVLNAYSIALGGLLLVGGRIGDLFGRRLVLQAGVLLYTVATLMAGLAQNPGWLVGARAAEGVGAALAAPGVLALISTSATGQAEVHRGLRYFASASSVGGVLGLFVGGVVTDLFSWRAVYFLNVPLGLLVLVAVRRYVVETPRFPQRINVVAALSVTLGTTSLIWVLVGSHQHGLVSAHTLAGLAVSAALFGVFAAIEGSSDHPLVHREMVLPRTRLGGLVAIAFVMGSQLSMTYLVVQFMQHELGYSGTESGLGFLPLTLSLLLMSQFAPRLVARFGAAPLAAAGGFGLAASYIWMSMMAPHDSYARDFLGPMVAGGFSVGLAMVPLSVLVMENVRPEHAGGTSGLLQSAQQLGAAISLAVVAAVFAATSVPGDMFPAVQAGLHVSAVFALLAAAAACISTRRTSATGIPLRRRLRCGVPTKASSAR